MIESATAYFPHKDAIAGTAHNGTTAMEKLGSTVVLSPDGGEFQPGLHANVAAQKKIANPAPLGLGAFALTTFVLSCINLKVLDITEPNLVVALAYGYGGIVQLLAGMWEMAVGNTFGATALSSYGGFWLSFACVLTPALDIVESYTDKETGESNFNEVFALYLWGWFIFTTLCMLLTLRSSLAFMSLFVVLYAAFLCLALSEQYAKSAVSASANLKKAGGVFGLLAAFTAWYNMFVGLADQTNFWWDIPVIHLPTSASRPRKRDADRV